MRLSAGVLAAVTVASASAHDLRHGHGHHNHALAARKTNASPKVPVYTTCAKSGSVAIAFDDGPFPLDANLTASLDKNGVKGTFFLNGYNWDCIYESDLTDSITARFNEGHMIASHTWSHCDLATLNEVQLNRQFQLVEDALVKILGIRPLFFRPPYGSYNDLVLQVAYQRGYKGAVTWDFDSLDSTDPDTPAAKEIKAYKSHFKGGPTKGVKTSITLNHDVKADTVEKVIPKVVPWLKKQGYTLQTVGTCLNIPSSEWYVKVGKPQKRDATWTCVGTPGPGVP